MKRYRPYYPNGAFKLGLIIGLIIGAGCIIWTLVQELFIK